MAKRHPNFTSFEKRILLDNIRLFQNIIEDKRTDKMTSREKESAWAEVTRRYNAHEGMHQRVTKQLEYCWKNMKSKYHSQNAAVIRLGQLTGEIPRPVSPEVHISIVDEIMKREFEQQTYSGQEPATPDEDSLHVAVGEILKKEVEDSPDLQLDGANDEQLEHEDKTDEESDRQTNITTSLVQKFPTVTACNAVDPPVPTTFVVNAKTHKHLPQIESPAVRAKPTINSKLSRKSGVPPFSVKRKTCNQRTEMTGDNFSVEYRRKEHLQRMRNLRMEQRFMILRQKREVERHKKKMELLNLKISKEKADSIYASRAFLAESLK